MEDGGWEGRCEMEDGGWEGRCEMEDGGWEGRCEMEDGGWEVRCEMEDGGKLRLYYIGEGQASCLASPAGCVNGFELASNPPIQ